MIKIKLLVFVFVGFLTQQVRGQNQNKAPGFLAGGDLARFSIPEDTPVGSVIYRLKGSDPEGGQLTYSISGEYFRVNRKTGDLTLIKELDREIESSILVIISLTDDGQGLEPLTVSLRREIIVLDRNDNPPEFHRRPYSFRVSERTQVGSTVFSDLSITDKDFGPNAEITLTCAEDETRVACETFSITAEKVAEGSYVGIITLVTPLDFEKHPSYAMTIKASDGLNVATALVAITILDIQDQAPQFFGAPYVFRVKENSPPGTKIGEISVQDGDTGNPRDLQLRLIDEFQNNYFRLVDIERDSFSGTFTATVETTENNLDAEDDFVRANLGIYELVLEAREIPRSPEDREPTLVTRKGLAVVVEDVDDNIPIFSPSQVSHVLQIPYNPEEAHPFPQFAVEVEDRDVTPGHSQFTLQFEWNLRGHVSAEEVFSFVTPSNDHPTIQSKGIVTIEASNISLLSPGSTFDLYIAAFANDHLLNKLNIPCEVAPTGRILPRFNQTVYRAAIPENIGPGELITQISAENQDELPDVKYTLIGVGSDRFNVDEGTGEIRCGRPGCLDYEKDKSHFFLVRAKSGKGVDEEVFALFYLDVIETNDNYPEFESEPGTVNAKLSGGQEIRRTVLDGTTTFDPPFFVRALDSDLNDRVTYTLIDRSMDNSGLRIDSETGEILLDKMLKWSETGEHRLLVKATDKTGKVSEQSVLLIVRAVANLPPNFPYKLHSLWVNETLGQGAPIFKVTAHDPDGQDAELKYEIVGQPEPDLFAIEEKSGLIRLGGGRLDFEDKLRVYPLRVRVQDEGTPSESETVTIEINVRDINDEDPKFALKNFVAEMSETSKPDQLVLQLLAEDPDVNAELEYEISCTPCQAWDPSGSPLNPTDSQIFFESFRVDPQSGEILLQNTIEHKKSSVVEFQASVRDRNGVYGSQVDTSTVTIYIMAAERTRPIFGNPWTIGNPWINLTIPEDIEVGSVVVTLNAWDYIADETIGEFRLENGEEMKEFLLEGNELRVKSELDYEIKDLYILAVRAIDKRGEESIANLQIKLSDVNDHDPVFSKPEYKGKVVENSEFPTPILTVEASDRDDADNYGAIRYALSGPQASLFTIDPLAGVIQVSPGALIDREKDSVHNIYVLALDTPAGGPFQRTATAQLQIQVQDLNDNDPSCQPSPDELIVGENAPIGLHFGNITCKDPDLQPKLTYMLKDDQFGLFFIDPSTGALKVLKSLRGRGRSAPYIVQIIIEDGKERTVSLGLPIKIANLIPNDGRPKFTNENFTAVISEGSQRSSPVLLVKAEDPDSYDNGEGRLGFKILKQMYPCHTLLQRQKSDLSNAAKENGPIAVQDVDFFRIDDHTGLLSLKESIDREKFECFSVFIAVEDFGTPPQGDSTWFEIWIKDLDDSLPHLPLEQKNVKLSLNETMPKGLEFLKLTSIDDDIYPNNQVVFEISGGGTDLFKIIQNDHQNASLVLNGDLSTMERDELNLIIKCHPKEKKISLPECTSKIQIKILRSGDFINNLIGGEGKSHLENNKNSEILLGVASSTPVGNLIGNLGWTKFIQSSEQMFHPNSYSSSPYNVSEIFRIDSDTGDIFVWDNLVPYKEGHLRVEFSDEKSGLLRRNLKIFIAPNDYLLSADMTDFGKVQRWIEEAGNLINNSPDKRGRIGNNNRLYKLLTFDQTTGFEGKTKICFQILENENMVSQEKALALLEKDELQDLFLKYSFETTKKGCPERPRLAAKLTYGASSGPNGGRFWVEKSLVGIATVVAIASLSAIMILCLVSKNRRLKD